MRVRSVWVLLALLGAPGCAKKGQPEEAAQTKAETKADKCKRVATELIQQSRLFAGLMANGLSDDPSAGQRAAEEVGAELDHSRLFEECMAWPEETVNCLADPLYVVTHIDECNDAASVAAGEAPPPPKDVPAGPSPAWSHIWKGTPEVVELLGDGMVVALFNDYEDDQWYRALVAVKDGEVQWSHDDEYASWIVRLPDGGLVVAKEHELIAIDPATGERRWATKLPEDPEGYGPARPATAVLAGDALLVGDADARFFNVGLDGKRVSPAGRLETESLDDDARLFVTPDGTRYLWEYSDLRAFDASWETRFHVRGHESITAVGVHGDRLVAAVDDEVIAFSSGQCGSPGAFAPSGWPHPGDLYMRDLDECSDCPSAPSGCVAWAQHVEELAPEPFAVSASGEVIVNGDKGTSSLGGGQITWTASTAAGGQVALGERIYVVQPGGEDSKAVLRALHPKTGKHTWASDLPGGAEGWLYSSDEVHVKAEGTRVIAGYGDTISMFDVG